MIVQVGVDPDGFPILGDPVTGRSTAEEAAHLSRLLGQARRPWVRPRSGRRVLDPDGWPVELPEFW